jgi:hypothetical protein
MNANRIFFLIGGIAIVAVLALGWFLGVAPLLDEASASDAERQTVEAENTAQNAVLAQMKEQYAQLDELNLQLEELQLSVPALAQVEEFIDLTMRVAYASGTKVSSITITEGSLYGGNIVPGTVPPPEPASTDTTTGEPAAAVTSAALQPTAGLAANLYAIPITIVLENNPVKAAAFLKKIQRAQRLLLVNAVTLSSSPASSNISGYLFVVSSGLPVIPTTPEPTETPDPNATPTPTPTDGATPAPTGTPTPTATSVPAS